MTRPIISVENLSKRYTLRHQQGGYRTLRDTLADKLRSMLGRNGPAARAAREEFWALKDVSFQINRGDVVGIIGRNGAGKSTLLKILSRITEPTSGTIRLGGRVASLLEVGTGFHPELTGRENIFLNGAILGMTKAEIRSKFDEIVAFAEVEKFLDTAVKHYSSGMYVRLAFAVAAHLSSDVMIIDEVLAVGDISFQKKCLAKMQDVASGGRTILFVSHNLTAVAAICTHGVYLDEGQVAKYGTASSVMGQYTSDVTSRQENARNLGKTLLRDISITSLRNQETISGWVLSIDFVFSDVPRTHDVGIDVVIRNKDVALAFAGSAYFQPVTIGPTTKKVRCVIGPVNFALGHYEIDVYLNRPMLAWIEEHPSCISFDIERQPGASLFFQLDSNRNIGLIVPNQSWCTEPSPKTASCS